MRTIIHIQVDEELASVYERLKHFVNKKIHLVIPNKALIFQSVVNLQILKGRLKKKRNSLFIITKDSIGRHLCQQAGLKAMSHIELSEKIKSVPSSIEEQPKVLVQPIQARRNEIIKETPKLIGKKLTIGELLRQLRKKTHSKEKAKELLSYLPKSRSYLFALVLTISVGLFFLITYIALPGATIYIHPNFETINHAINVTLADSNKNQSLLARNEPNIIASQTIVREVSQTRFFNTSGTDFNGQNAKGEITIINTAEEPWEFQDGTRFQSPEGIIFRIKQGIKVPGAIRDGSGALSPTEYKVSVEADPYDRFRDSVGERGNIGPSEFIIPGLSRFNQELVWAESTAPMTGGVTSYTKVVMESDIEAAKKQLQESLLQTARSELNAYIDELNRFNNTSLVLLDDEKYLKSTLDEMRLSDDLLGSSREKFEIFAKMTVRGIAFDFSQLFTLLKEELHQRSHPDMGVLDDSIRPDRVDYEVVEQDEALGRIKLTVEVDGLQEYQIDTESEAGLRFVTRAKEKILNLTLQEAESYLTNLPEVDRVEIKTWPFWVSKIPRVPGNIKIKLLED